MDGEQRQGDSPASRRVLGWRQQRGIRSCFRHKHCGSSGKPEVCRVHRMEGWAQRTIPDYRKTLPSPCTARAIPMTQVNALLARNRVGMRRGYCRTIPTRCRLRWPRRFYPSGHAWVTSPCGASERYRETNSTDLRGSVKSPLRPAGNSCPGRACNSALWLAPMSNQGVQAVGAVKRGHRVKGKFYGLMTDGWLRLTEVPNLLFPMAGVGGPFPSRFTN